MTKTIIEAAGSNEVCSVCGDLPAADYKVIGVNFSEQIGASIRLCDDCREIRRDGYAESYIKF